MGVFPETGVKSDVDRQREIPQRAHPEDFSQVYGNGDLDRPGFLSVLPFRFLPFRRRFREYCGQEGGHSHTLLVRFLQQDVRGQDPGDDMAELIRFRRTAEPVGRILRPADRPLRAAGKEAVPRFLCLRLFRNVDDVSLRRDLRPVFQRQIPGGQVLQQDQASRSVGHGMEDLHGDPVFIIQEAYAAGLQFPARHMCQRIGIILLRLRRLRDRLQVVPEKAGPQADEAGRKPGFQFFDRPVQDSGIHRLFQRRRNPEHVVPVFPDDRRKDQRGVIQPVPLFLHLFLRKCGPGKSVSSRPYAQK